MNQHKLLVVVEGPTAVGKTDVGVEIAKYFNTEIISADSRQIFKEMKIGTARPDDDTLKIVKHYFIATKSIHDYYNASMFENEVLQILEKKIFTTNNISLMVGGSMLYIDAVCNGIDLLPNPDEKIRNNLWQQFENEGLNNLLEQLQKLDPQYYNQVDKKNHKRIIKALEVCLQTGQPYSKFRTGQIKQRNFEIVRIGINTQREILHQRINNRVDKMVEQGLVDEAKKLFEYRNLNSLNTVGYKEIFDYLENKIDLPTAIELIKRNTRRYARKQISWFSRDKKVEWYNPNQTQEIIKKIELHFNNQNEI